MSLFSYRKGIKKEPDSYQIKSISQPLKNRLWTCLFNKFFSSMYSFYPLGNRWENPENRRLCEILWHYFFKFPIDNLSDDGEDASRFIRNFFLVDAQWYEIYDFIEFCSRAYKNPSDFAKCINDVLKEEFAGYTLINGNITQITDSEEIVEIERALAISDVTSVHLETALKHLSDKTNPDYRNSIKESISAVEAMCSKIVGNKGVTLGDALKAIERGRQIEFHGAEKAAFSALYGWTCDANGIRHGLWELPDLHQEDARFMLISCSAFINYLKVKANNAGIKIN